MIRLISGVKIGTGDLVTPGGIPYKGFMITLGGSQDNKERAYEDIEEILGKNKVNYTIQETKNQYGKFKSYSVFPSPA